MDPNLVRAVIKAESLFDPQAVGPRGARGLMQLMPSTLRSLGVHDAFDPEQNILAGVRYLKELLEVCEGDPRAALAAYNAGPGAVASRVPKATRRYVDRVMDVYASFVEG